LIILLISVLMLAVPAPPVPAEEVQDERSGWEFDIAVYMWALSLSGDLTAHNYLFK
jgi:hypothetical protein